MNIQWVSAARILVATSLGVGTTLALLLLMQGFIDDPEVQLNDPAASDPCGLRAATGTRATATATAAS